MKPHYFDQDKADTDDIQLGMAKAQGYVSRKCLLNGELVMHLIRDSKSPCEGCACSRKKCEGLIIA